MEKSSNFQDDQYVPPPASAPTYEEAMKCSAIPPNDVMTYPNLVEMQSAAAAEMVIPTQMPLTMQPTLQMTPVVPSQQQMPTYVQTAVINGLPAVCPSCAMPLRTRVDYTTTCSTHCACFLCCIFGLVLCAPCVYCTKCCREPRLKCAHCNAPMWWYNIGQFGVFFFNFQISVEDKLSITITIKKKN